MPTHDELEEFWRDWDHLSMAQKERFTTAIKKMVADLKAGRGFRKGLRVKGVQGHEGIFEMTWAGDGRATFHYGTSPNAGDVHIIWRHIGGHEILDNP
jgi:hypothetical protein